VSYLLAGVLEQHDRARFEIIALSFAPIVAGGMQQRLRSACDRFYDLRAVPETDIVKLARELQIDIAINLNGYTQGGRFIAFAHGLAPLQVNFLGYGGTMAAPYMDYILGDATLIPFAHQPYYTEKIVHLPNSYMPTDDARPVAEVTPDRPELGLPTDAFVFSCFNNSYKISPQTFDLWMDILAAVPESVLWLKVEFPVAEKNLRAAASSRGVDPARLVFAARVDDMAAHLARQRAADLFLDTAPYNAHTTTVDALWVGLPVLTREDAAFVGRAASSLLKAIGLPELVTHTPEEYRDRAIALARDPVQLAALRARLKANRLTQPLFNTKLYTRHLEAAYTTMYERLHDGKRPEQIVVSPRT
jgi:predicted O-linked N-acetylglucosamine transferase (SPINDLY family)